jgi:hypothetical protein
VLSCIRYVPPPETALPGNCSVSVIGGLGGAGQVTVTLVGALEVTEVIVTYAQPVEFTTPEYWSLSVTS